MIEAARTFLPLSRKSEGRRSRPAAPQSARPRRMREGLWLQTASGRAWPLHQPQASDVSLDDIAAALAKTCRFGGASRKFYSVAEHSCRVAALLPPWLRAHGLLHEAHAAYLGDLAAPTTEALRAVGGDELLAALVESHDRAIHEAAGLRWPLDKASRAIIREADLTLLATERRDLLAPCERLRRKLPEPLMTPIKPFSWEAAELLFRTQLSLFLPRSSGMP